MLFVQLDVNWVDHPKVMEVGLEGAGLHAMAMCMAKRMETDGILHRAHLLRVGATHDLIDRLIDAGLFDLLDEKRIRIHGWLDRNPSQGAIAASRSARSASGREGNHRRWGHPGPVETCPRCNPPEPDFDPSDGDSEGSLPWSSQGASRNGSGCDRDASRGDSPETETETETETERARDSNVVDMPSPDVTALCNLLAERVGAFRESPPPRVTQRWHRDMRLLIERGPLHQDRPTPLSPAKIERSIHFLFDRLAEPGRDGFCWAAQVRSPHALRDHWHQIAVEHRRLTRQTRSETTHAMARAVGDDNPW